MSHLYSAYRVRELELKNRIVMSPMCMFMAADDGRASDWHLVHYGSRAIGGVGLIIQEATAVERRGRITARDLGLWEDSQVEPQRRLVDNLHALKAKVGVQLAHSGRKCEVPGETMVAPSALNWSDKYPVPQELATDEIGKLVESFGLATKRAALAGFDLVEVHAAHGYLIHEFLSPLSNTRRDGYGGSRENRVRFLREVLQEVRANLPPGTPLAIRISATDYVAGGLDLEETIAIITMVRDLVDLVDVSSGGLLAPRIDLYPGYQVGFAAAIRARCALPTVAVGLITQPEHAEAILAGGQADLVALGRELLRQPYWPLLSAKRLGEDLEWPPRYRQAKV